MLIVTLNLAFCPTISSTVFWIVHSVSPSPRTDLLSLTIFHPSTPLLSIFATASSPSVSCPVAEQLSIWTVLPPAGHHSSSALPSHAGRPKRVLRASRACHPPSSCPPLPFSNCFLGPCQPRGSHVQGSLPPTTCLHRPPTRSHPFCP